MFLFWNYPLFPRQRWTRSDINIIAIVLQGGIRTTLLFWGAYKAHPLPTTTYEVRIKVYGHDLCNPSYTKTSSWQTLFYLRSVFSGYIKFTSVNLLLHVELANALCLRKCLSVGPNYVGTRGANEEEDHNFIGDRDHQHNFTNTHVMPWSNAC